MQEAHIGTIIYIYDCAFAAHSSGSERKLGVLCKKKGLSGVALFKQLDVRTSMSFTYTAPMLLKKKNK